MTVVVHYARVCLIGGKKTNRNDRMYTQRIRVVRKFPGLSGKQFEYSRFWRRHRASPMYIIWICTERGLLFMYRIIWCGVYFGVCAAALGP